MCRRNTTFLKMFNLLFDYNPPFYYFSALKYGAGSTIVNTEVTLVNINFALFSIEFTLLTDTLYHPAGADNFIHFKVK